MNTKLFIIIFINVLYLGIWFFIYQLRQRSSLIRKWDNGNEFYESLDPVYKEEYWHQDTHIVNMFFIILLVFIELTLILFVYNQFYWIITLVLGVVIAIGFAIRESIKLQKAYKKVR